jgi:hypothetical protein
VTRVLLEARSPLQDVVRADGGAESLVSTAARIS